MSGDNEKTEKDIISEIAAWDTAKRITIKEGTNIAHLKVEKIPWEDLLQIWYKLSEQIIPKIEDMYNAYRKAVQDGKSEMEISLSDLVRDIPEVIDEVMRISYRGQGDVAGLKKIDTDIYLELLSEAISHSFIGNERVVGFIKTVVETFTSTAESGSRQKAGA